MFCRNIRYKYKKPLWLRCYNVIKLNLSVVYNLFSENWNFQAWQVLTAVTLVCNLRCAFKYKNLRSSLNHFPLFLAMMATPRSEVYQWLCSISNGLQLERLAGEFESRGFRTVDLDVLFPSPHKLMMAEKRIIESEIEKVKSLKSGQLPPREPFPALPRQVSYDQTPTFTSPFAANVVFLNNTSINKTFRLTAKVTQPTSYLKRRGDDLKHDNDLLAAQIQIANDVLEMKTREFDLLVGIRAISCFLIVYKFWPVCKSRSLIAVASGYLYFRICRVDSHRQVKFRNKSDCLLKTQSRNSLLTNQLLIG